MEFLATLSQGMDVLFIGPFRLMENPYLGFALGLAWIALIATVVGELSQAGAYFFNRGHFGKMHREMVRHNNLSVRAIGMKDKASYKACNSIANDEFGKQFFAGIALFAASLWPAFVVLAWLDGRFGAVRFELPLLGEVGSAFFFVPVYILVRIGFAYAKPWLPVFRTLKRMVAENEGEEELITYMDLVKKEDGDAEKPAHSLV